MNGQQPANEPNEEIKNPVFEAPPPPLNLPSRQHLPPQPQMGPPRPLVYQQLPQAQYFRPPQNLINRQVYYRPMYALPQNYIQGRPMPAYNQRPMYIANPQGNRPDLQQGPPIVGNFQPHHQKTPPLHHQHVVGNGVSPPVNINSQNQTRIQNSSLLQSSTNSIQSFTSASSKSSVEQRQQQQHHTINSNQQQQHNINSNQPIEVKPPTPPPVETKRYNAIDAILFNDSKRFNSNENEEEQINYIDGYVDSDTESVHSQPDSLQSSLKFDKLNINGGGSSKLKDTSDTVSIMSSMTESTSYGNELELLKIKCKKTGAPTQDTLEYIMKLIEESCSYQPTTKLLKKYIESLHKEAQKYLKKLSSQTTAGDTNISEAQFILASHFGNGTLSLPVNHQKAFGLYLLASKSNHSASTYRVAVCYEIGAGVKKDTKKSESFYRKGASLGNLEATFKYSMMLLKGNTDSGSPEGLTLLKRSANAANESLPDGLYQLAILYESISDTTRQLQIQPDFEYAYNLYLKAAQLNHPPSQHKLGVSFEHGHLNLPTNPRRSIAWYTRAAAQGFPEAELALSGWYLTGADGVLRQDNKEAYLWARKSADRGLARGEFAVGYYTENGIGVEVGGFEGARRWYLRAAGQGGRRALERLKSN